MNEFAYEKVRENIDDPKKWYVSYTIKFPQPYSYQPDKNKPKYQKPKSTHYIKVYGGEYAIRLNDFKGQERVDKLMWLLKAVKKDLALGVDPKRKLEILGEQILAEAEQARGISYDEAIQIMIDYYNWDNPVPSARLTAHNARVFFNAAFRKEVTLMKKLDDVREINRTDIEQLLIEKNKSGKWNIQTCLNRIGAISQLFIPLLDKGIIQNNPCIGINNIKTKLKRIPQRPRVKLRRYEVWTDEELKEFVEVTNCPEYRFYYALGMTCYHAFIRRSEAFRMRLGMLDLSRRRFCLDSDLTKSARRYDVPTNIYLPVSKVLCDILDTYVQERFGEDRNPDYFLFPSITRNDKEYPYFQYDVDYEKKLGGKLTNNKAKYDLKHTGVSNFWKEQTGKGIQVSLVLARLQKMCRHATILQTMDYLTTNLGIEMDGDIFD